MGTQSSTQSSLIVIISQQEFSHQDIMVQCCYSLLNDRIPVMLGRFSMQWVPGTHRWWVEWVPGKFNIHFLFGTTQWRKLFTSMNLCRWLCRLHRPVVPALDTLRSFINISTSYTSVSSSDNSHLSTFTVSLTLLYYIVYASWIQILQGSDGWLD